MQNSKISYSKIRVEEFLARIIKIIIIIITNYIFT